MKIIAIFFLLFLYCANNLSAKNWVAHARFIHEKPRFFRVDTNNSGYFFYNDNYPDFIFRISSTRSTYRNQFVFYKTTVVNDSLLELKSLGYDDIKVNVYERISFDEASRRLKVTVNGYEIFHDLEWMLTARFVLPNKALYWMDRQFTAWVSVGNDSLYVLKIDGLNEYSIVLPNDLKHKNVLVEIMTPSSIWNKQNSIGYHSKLLLQLKDANEFNTNPEDVLQRNFFNSVDFFETTENFMTHFKEHKTILRNFLKMKTLDEHGESIFDFVHQSDERERKPYQFADKNSQRKQSVAYVFEKMKARGLRQ